MGKWKKAKRELRPVSMESVKAMLDTLTLNLRLCRERTGLSITEIADQTGVQRDSYIQYEAGKNAPLPQTLVRIAGFFGIKAGDLFKKINWESWYSEIVSRKQVVITDRFTVSQSKKQINTLLLKTPLELIAGNLRRLRKKAALTQAMLGARVGLKRTTIMNIEHGRQRPQLSTFIKILKGLEVEAEQFTLQTALETGGSKGAVTGRARRKRQNSPKWNHAFCLEVGKRIKSFREGLKLNKNEFAQISGVRPTNLYMYENGKTMPTTETLCRIAAGLEVEIDDLIK